MFSIVIQHVLAGKCEIYVHIKCISYNLVRFCYPEVNKQICPTFIDLLTTLK